MNKILNIVNGDVVIESMKKANIPGSFLPWRDFLHEGPVPENLSLEALSKIRAEYISSRNLGEFKQVHQNFKERNATLHAFRKYEKIVLWFEHDLYDQLQLIQILDWFAKYASDSTSISLICPDKHLGVCSPEKLQELLLYNKEQVTHNHFIVARKAWAAFTSPNPKAWSKLLHDDISALPFLRFAVTRMLEEYPNSINGLSRTAHQALLIIAREEVHSPQEIFERYQKTEQRRFMGDVLFFNILQNLVQKKLLNSTEDGKHLELTPLGTDVLKGERNWLHQGNIDFWLGGVHFHSENVWCWNIESQRVVRFRQTTPLQIT
ncbi:MAG: DUF1835 domain-containing protein [Epsilonproteobacteria bacterium]|nr:DUF1835 domain-containing protein [Campylobacterota bacterium]